MSYSEYFLNVGEVQKVDTHLLRANLSANMQKEEVQWDCHSPQQLPAHQLSRL